MRARGKVGLYFITGIKETQNGTRAARTRARITSTLTQQIVKDVGSESLHSSWGWAPPWGYP